MQRLCGAQVSLSPVIRREQHVAQEAAAAAAATTQHGEIGMTDAPAEALSPDAQPQEESAAAAGGGGTRTVPVPYVVGPHDTWQSICLKHRMSTEELRTLNGLPYHNRRARVGDVLLVWAERSEVEQTEDWKRQLVRQFRRLTGCSSSEAAYYLETHEYQIGEALRERTHDHAWESERALLVRNLLREEELKAMQLEAEEKARAEAAALEAEVRALATERHARAAAHAEALRSLSTCLPPERRGADGNARCLACFG